jgi:hypothetical protein
MQKLIACFMPPRQSAGRFYEGDKAAAADQADYLAADAGVGSMAAEVKRARFVKRLPQSIDSRREFGEP